MAEVADYLRLAASNSKTAEACLKDAEDSLHDLVARLEGCMECVARIKQDETLFCVQPDTLIYDSRSKDNQELHL